MFSHWQLELGLASLQFRVIIKPVNQMVKVLATFIMDLRRADIYLATNTPE